MSLNLIISENQFYMNQFQVKDYFFKVLFPQNQFQYQYLHQTGFDQRSRTIGSDLQTGFLRAIGPEGGVCRRLLPLCLVGTRSWEGKSDMSRENWGQTGSREEEINQQGQTVTYICLSPPPTLKTQVTCRSQVFSHGAAHVLGPGLKEVKGGDPTRGGAMCPRVPHTYTWSHQFLGPPPTSIRA